MARKRRIEVPGATYHVYSRGNRGAGVFPTPGEYAAFVEDLERLSGEHGVAVLGFCLMPNHTHLCLRTRPGGSRLSALMQRLNLRHAQRFNWAHEVRGRLNESRYNARMVDSERYLLRLVRYIHQNPVRAGLVGRPEDWRPSSHLAYLGLEFRFVATWEVLQRCGGRSGYLQLMALREPKEALEFLAPGRPGRPRRPACGGLSPQTQARPSLGPASPAPAA